MQTTLVRIGAIGVSTLMIGSLGLSGVAAADSISDTGPFSSNNIVTSTTNRYARYNTNTINLRNENQQTATTGSVFVGDNTLAGCGAAVGTLPTNWSGWNPATWQSNGQGFSAWWTNLMQQLGSFGNSWSGGGNSWAPSGSNWQTNWDNWNPATWQSNGQSFGNWYGTLLPYLMQHYSSWQTSWPCGGATSGNASNNNTTATSITVNNGGAVLGATSGTPGVGGGSIFLTGPYSTNTIKTRGSYGYLGANTNAVGVGGGNYQGAASGNVGGNTNTGFAGGSGSGGAMNQNGAQTGVGVTNNSGAPAPVPIPAPSPAAATISTTGPHSTNTITTTSSNCYAQTNTNNVNVSNVNDQQAGSGTVTVSDNTAAGGAMSGNASNGNYASSGVVLNN